VIPIFNFKRTAGSRLFITQKSIYQSRNGQGPDFSLPAKTGWLSAAVVVLLLLLPFNSFSQEYGVGEGDLLHITVYDNPDLTSDVRVSGDGKINVPPIGEVYVNGLTTIGISNKLAELFRDGFIKDPQVNVFIAEYKSKKVTALGEFAKPGLTELKGNSRLMEVISNAGGLTPDAGEMLFVQRKVNKPGDKDNGKEVTLPVDLVKLLQGGDATLNLPVVDGDSIFVPRTAFVYVNGEVSKPGAYKITKELTVLRSITLAGGFTAKAAKGRTKIIRKTDKGEITLGAKMDALVMPDDIIVVPESFF